MPVASATLPPSDIATRIPVPAASIAAPRAAKIPVPTIIAAVNNVAVGASSSRLRLLPAPAIDTLTRSGQDQTGDRRGADERRLGHLEAPQDAEREQEDRERRDVHEDLGRDHRGRTDDRPAAADVALFVKPCTAGCFRQRMIRGANSTTMRYGGRNTPMPAAVAPASPATR